MIVKINRGYTITMYPNPDQIQVFEQSFGNRRFVFNNLVSIYSSGITEFVDDGKIYKIGTKKVLKK